LLANHTCFPIQADHSLFLNLFVSHFLLNPKESLMTLAPPNLRPRTVVELLDLAIRLYRRNFLTFIGIVAVMQVPIVLLQLLVSLATFGDTFAQLQDQDFFLNTQPEDFLTPTVYGGIIGTLCLTLLSWVLIQGVATAAMTRAVADHYLGETITIVEAYRSIGQAWLPLVLALVVAMLLALVFLIWGLVPCLGWLTGIGIFLFWMFVVTPLVAPVVVLEAQTPGRALRRAWDLARRRFWPVLGFVFILFILGQLLITVPVTLISQVTQILVGSPLTGNGAGAFTVGTIVQTLTSLGFSLIYLPLQIAGITLLYFDLRVRTEGFDLAVAAETAAEPQITVSEILAQTPGPAEGSIMTGNELKNFVLVSLIGVAGVLILWGALAILFALLFSMGAGI
jgi:hypothetical protein